MFGLYVLKTMLVFAEILNHASNQHINKLIKPEICKDEVEKFEPHRFLVIQPTNNAKQQKINFSKKVLRDYIADNTKNRTQCYSCKILKSTSFVLNCSYDFFLLVKAPSQPENMFFVNRRCCCGPLLNALKFLKVPETVKGVMGGSDKHNIVRKCLQLLVSAGENPKQVLELFCREFYQSKNHIDLDLGSTVCIEIKTKNDKRIMRRVKIASKAANVTAYIDRVYKLLDCCPNVFVSEKYPTEQCESCRLKQTEEHVIETNVLSEAPTLCSNLLEPTGFQLASH